MTPHLSERAASGCPCGRVHPASGVPRRRELRGLTEGLPPKVYEALCAGKAVKDAQGHWWVHYSKDCQEPLQAPVSDLRLKGSKSISGTFIVRCRRCKACLRARTNYWGFAAMNETVVSQANGDRTWFGTLTLRPEAQAEVLTRARMAADDPNAEYWDDVKCDARFAAVRQQLLRETQLYWKRLRKAGHSFKYFLVFERHKSGLPHMHFLLHEKSGHIRKRELQAQWALGFSNVSIVGGRSKNAAAPEKAAWYVTKYLSKSVQSRQIASKQYRPTKEPLGHRDAEPPVM